MFHPNNVNQIQPLDSVGTVCNNLNRELKMCTYRVSHSDLIKGPFTNYVDKRRGVGGQKNNLNFYTIENVNGGGQKKPNLVK